MKQYCQTHGKWIPERQTIGHMAKHAKLGVLCEMPMVEGRQKQATHVRYSALRIWWERIKPRVQYWRDRAVGPVVIGGVIWMVL